ncbi:MAG: TIM barrel protein [Bacteroidaceae bacterium]|nr:TIM barrel protein [Bacteroidaceae bacterium]
MKKQIYLSLIAFLLLCIPAGAAQKEMSLQLYSLRTLIGKPELYAKNHAEVFKKLKQYGYTGAEAAHYGDGKFYGVSPEQYKKDLEDAGLKSVSSHTAHRLSKEELANHDFTAALEWWDEAIKAHKAAGMKYIVTPSDHFPKSLKEAQTLCDYHNAIGQKCKAAGIKYGYHSHSFEYEKIEGTDVLWYDYFIQNTNPEYVFFQMDVYWCVMAKQAPVHYYKKYPGRFELLHIKDRYELGESGMVGFDAIFNNYKLSGMKGYVVEMEHTDGTIDIMEGVKRCAQYLQNLKEVKASYSK